MPAEVFEKVIDELIALIVVVSTVLFMYFGVEIPEPWWTAFGMVVAFYFSRKAMKESRK